MIDFKDTLIFTDLDGTFLGDYSAVIPRNIEAVKYFIAHGGEFGIVTGRGPHVVKSALPDIAKYVNMPSVLCNGACIYDFVNDKVISARTLDIELVRNIKQYVAERFPTAASRATSLEYGFMCTAEDARNAYVGADVSRIAADQTLIAELDEWAPYNILKYCFRDNEDLILVIRDAILSEFSDRVEVTHSWPTTIEVIPRGTNKGNAVRAISEKKNKTVYACGDYLNDAEMLIAADVSVCPAGAHPYIKDIAALCLCDCHDGLIADLVNYIEKKKEKEET